MNPHISRDEFGDILLETWDYSLCWRLSLNEALHVQAALNALLAEPPSESESLSDA